MTGFAIELPSRGDAPRRARVLIRERLAEAMPAATLYDLLTIVTELVTNGVRHGSGETVKVIVRVDGDGAINGEVRNDGRGRVEPRAPDPTRGDGLGLHIVAAIADGWRVLIDDSTRVRFELQPL